MMGDFEHAMEVLKNMPREMQDSFLNTVLPGPQSANSLGSHDIDFDSFGKQRAHNAVLQHHKKVLDNYWRTRSSPNKVSINLSHPTLNAKPTTTTSKRPIELLPIHLKTLQVGTTHRGRLLRGELIVDPIPLVSVQSVIEDEFGDVCAIAFYNIGPVQKNDDDVMAMLKRGTKVIVCEPYLKITSDGHYGIRIDDFNDVIFIDAICPFTGDDVTAWKDEGNGHFASKQFTEAAHCYQVALSKCDQDVVAVLCNISTTCRCLSDYWFALHYAVAAISVAPSNFKANYRMAEALEALKLIDLSLHYCQQASGLGDAGACRPMRNRLVALKRGKKAQKLDDPIEQIVLLLVDSCPSVQLSVTPPAAIVTEKSKAAMAHCKEIGNEFYKDGSFEDALRTYIVAMQDNRSGEVATLLGNLSACALSEKRFVDAAMKATAAAVIDPTSVKAHYRRVTALLDMKMPDRALVAIQAAPMKNNKAIVELRGRIEIQLKQNDDDDYECHRKGTTEREAHLLDPTRHNVMRTDQVAMMNDLMHMAVSLSGSKEHPDLNPVDDRVVPFHEIYARQGIWPVACDISVCQRKLSDGFEHARGSKRLGFPLFAKQCIEDFNYQKQRDWPKRCGPGTGVALWLQTARIGDVRFPERLPYSDQVIHSFSNQPRIPIEFETGTTHVSVGFVDLGELLVATDVGSDEFQLRWIGYEASEYSVAKTLVIAEMLRMRAPALDILQVWFSATWTNEALQSFRKALSTVIQNNDQLEMIRKILNHWNCQHRGVPLSDARRRWLKDNPDIAMLVASFKLESDRSAMCSYVISGDLIPDPDVGSVVMFSIPDGCGYLSMNESIFQGISGEILFDFRKNHAYPDIIQVAIAFLCERISLVSKAVSDERLSIDVRFGQLSLESRETLLSIQKHLKPSTMSWSNLCDYYSPAEFHKMALRCSQPNTRHFISTMNWCRDVYGAFLLDYDDVKKRKKLAEESEEMMKKEYHKYNMEPFLFVPPIENPMNTVDSHLSYTMFPFWIDAFLKVSKVPIIESTTFKSIFTVLLRAPSSWAVAYVYDLNSVAQSGDTPTSPSATCSKQDEQLVADLIETSESVNTTNTKYKTNHPKKQRKKANKR